MFQNMDLQAFVQNSLIGMSLHCGISFLRFRFLVASVSNAGGILHVFAKIECSNISVRH